MNRWNYQHRQQASTMKMIQQGQCMTRRRGLNPPWQGGNKFRNLPVCPLCHVEGTCDMWEVEVDDAWEPEPLPPPVWSDSMAASSIRRAGYAESDVNIFPGTTPGAYEKVLFIFLDEPSIKAEDVYNYVRYRIREHIQGNPTEELRLVTNNEETLFDFFGWNVNRRVNALIKQWREVEPSFAPIISFEDYSGDSI